MRCRYYLLLNAGLAIHRLQDCLEVSDPIGRRDLNGHGRLATNVRRKFGQALLATATNAHKQRVSCWVVNDSSDSANVAHGVLEQHEIHLHVGFVVVLEARI